jgi:hypothetical protein
MSPSFFLSSFPFNFLFSSLVLSLCTERDVCLSPAGGGFVSLQLFFLFLVTWVGLRARSTCGARQLLVSSVHRLGV